MGIKSKYQNSLTPNVSDVIPVIVGGEPDPPRGIATVRLVLRSVGTPVLLQRFP
jgi:hypothetical protein